VVAVGVAAVVCGDVAAKRRGSRGSSGGWRLGWGVVGRSGSVCRRFRGAGGWFEAGKEVLVVVVNVVGSVDGSVDVADGSCDGIVNSDVARNGGVDRLVGVSLACMPVSQVLGSSVDIPASFSRRGGSSLGTVCILASTMQVGVVCELVFVVTRVVGSVCMLSSTLTLSCFVSHFSRSTVLPCSSPSFSPFS
jgi:hypothetical protein